MAAPVFSTPADLERLAAPHVARAWFARLDLPTGEARLHSGCGTLTVDGEEWQGVTDPVAGVLVSIGRIEEPRFGQAVALTITLSGANVTFLKSVHATRHEIEGRRADIYWTAFDQETQEQLMPLKNMFGRGRMTSPAIHWQGISRRTITLTIESIWSAQNFAPGGMWNDADQQRRYPGDKGLSMVGQKVTENWQ